MRSKTKKTGLSGVIGLLLMLQPAAALSAHTPLEAATPTATEELLISQRGGRGGGTAELNKKKDGTLRSLCQQILSVVRPLAAENGPKRDFVSV